MKIGDVIARNRKKGIFIVILVTALFLAVIAVNGIKYEFEEESFLPRNEVVEANERILKEYTNEYLVPILVKSKDGNILQKENLLEILDMEKRLYENFSIMPFSVADIVSSAFLYIQNETNMSYENKIKVMQQISDKNITQILNFPFFPRESFSLLLSKDFDGKKAEATVIKFGLNGSLIKDKKAALENESKVEKIVGQNYTHIETDVLGARIISEKIMKANSKSISILLPISFILVIMTLFFIYRNIKEVILSLLALGVAILWMTGLGALLGYTFNPMITSIPVLLVGLGIDYGIHIKKRINEEGIKKGLNSISTALFLSAFTTSVAFLSNISSSISTLKEFGILASFGIFSCLFVMLFFMATPAREEMGKDKAILNKLAIIAEKKKKTILITTLLVTITMSYFATTIEAEFDMMDFLPEKLEITSEINYLLKNFEAAEGEEAIIMIKGDVANPEMLKKIHSIEENIKDDAYVVNAGNSILSILSLMEDYAEKTFYDMRYNKSFALLYKNYFENGLPKENVTEKNIIQLYDLLYEIAPSDVKKVLHRNGEYDECIIRIATDTGKKEDNISVLYSDLKKDLNGNQGIITGGIISSYIILREFRSNQIKSLLITILFSFLILEIVFLKIKKSMLIGILSLIPVALSAIWIIGTMAILGIPLTITTITVASLAVGLGIDYSIHMSHRFMQENDLVKSVTSTGSALLGSTLTTIAAFGLLSFSFLPPLRIFGVAIAIAIFYSFILCVFILPVLLEMWKSSPFFK